MEARAKLFIFDLDGVLTDTAYYHYVAWKQLADEHDLYFNKAINEHLKGVSRIRSFEIILEVNKAIGRYSEDEKKMLADKKNAIYVELIKGITEKDILPGVVGFLDDARAMGIQTAVASASKNAFTVLRQLDIIDKFNYIADAKLIAQAKPNPEVFLSCAEALNIVPQYCIGFEDAEAGIQAIQAAGMYAVGIDVSSDKTKPQLMLKSTAELNLEKVLAAYNIYIK